MQSAQVSLQLACVLVRLKKVILQLQILSTLNVPYETVNILEDELLRSGMKEYRWACGGHAHVACLPPCLGLLSGQCWHHSLRAMTAESYTNGSLQEHLEAVMNS